MIILPVRHEDMPPNTYILIVGLKDENLARMKEYDPAEVTPSKLPKPWCDMQCTEVHITYCTDADLAKMQELHNAGKVSEATRWLVRGWAYRPKQGDHDDPPESLLAKWRH